jgi:hypothetical protein
MIGPDGLCFRKRKSGDPFKACFETDLPDFAQLAGRRIRLIKRACRRQAQDGFPEQVQVQVWLLE